MENSLLNLSGRVHGSRLLSRFSRTRADILARYSVGLRVVGLGILLILLCAPILGDLWNLWWNRYGFSHGFLVPLISLYLAWLQWPTLKQRPVEPAIAPGLLWLVVAAALLVASEVAGVMTMGSLAFILLLGGLVLLLGGVASVKVLAFPLAYLIFMTPVLDGLTEPLVWPFQLLTANMSVSLLQTLGVPALLEHDVFIVLPTVTIEVARECSGAGLLIAVLAIGLPLASLTLQAWWSRVTLVCSSIMIAIVANWVRLTVMGLYAQAGGKDLHGPYHILQGLFVDWVAFGFLFVGAWILGRMEPAVPTPSLHVGRVSFGRTTFLDPTSNRAWGLAYSTLAFAVVALYAVDGGTAEQKKDLATFPMVVGDWVADQTSPIEPLVAWPDADESLVRTYRTADGQRVTLSVAYTKTQRQGKELVGMRTAPLHEKANTIALQFGNETVQVNRTLLDQNRRVVPVMFWYHMNGRSYTDRTLTKLATLQQAVLRGRTDGALVMVSAEPRKGGREDSWNAQEAFAAAVFPFLREYLP